jgi:mono/diheme cytochrome c family protein
MQVERMRWICALAVVTSLAAVACDPPVSQQGWVLRRSNGTTAPLRVPAEYDGIANRYANSADAAMEGARIYGQLCAGCHGSTGAGGSIPSAGLLIAGAEAADGYLFWRILDGGASFQTEMPAYASALTADQIWGLVTYLRVLAGVANPTGTGPVADGGTGDFMRAPRPPSGTQPVEGAKDAGTPTTTPPRSDAGTPTSSAIDAGTSRPTNPPTPAGPSQAECDRAVVDLDYAYGICELYGDCASFDELCVAIGLACGLCVPLF